MRFCPPHSEFVRLLLGHFRRAKHFIFVVAIAFAQNVHCDALRAISTPDLSGLSSVDGVYRNFLVDERRQRAYVLGGFTHARGLSVSGMFRTNLAGQMDVAWRPQDVPRLMKASLTEDGDLLGITSEKTFSFVNGIHRTLFAARVLRVSAVDGRINAEYNVLPFAESGGSYLAQQPMASDGWVYVPVEYKLPSDKIGPTGRRGSTTRTRVFRFNLETRAADEIWALDVSGTAQIFGATTDSLFLRTNSATSPSDSQTSSIQRVSKSSAANERWTYSSSDFNITHGMLDQKGRAYFVARSTDPTKRQVFLKRLDQDGRLDSSWQPDSILESQSMLIEPPNIALVNGNVAILEGSFQGARRTMLAVLHIFDEAGRILRTHQIDDLAVHRAASVPQLVGGSRSLFVASSGFAANTLFSFDVASLAPRIRFELPSFGSNNISVKVLPLNDGGFLLSGRFSVWYEGIEFRNFVHLLPTGLPDFATRMLPDLAGDLAEISRNAANGELLLYAVSSTNDSVATFYLWPSDGKSGRAITVPMKNDEYLYSAAIGDDEWIYYVVSSASRKTEVRRVNRVDAVVDMSWRVEPKSESLENGKVYVSRMRIDSRGGLWLKFSPSSTLGGCPSVEWARYAISSTDKSPLTVPDAGCSYFDIVLSTNHAYVGTRRYALGEDLVEDKKWKPDAPGYFADDRYAYFFENVRDATPPKLRITRASTSGNGTRELHWSRSATGLFDPTNWFTMQDGRIANLGSVLHADESYSRAVFADVAPDDSARATPTVVEYYLPAANRYFITSRAAEKALLDGLPQAFRRTGMQFTASSAAFIDTQAQPVCRFYASPERGGSNTHFYGVGDDCKVVNALQPIAYEGYDFAINLLVDGMCPLSHNVAIFRFFNSAAGEANHRYVIDETTKTHMSSLGWRNEGVVFCAQSYDQPTQ
jgi:hypothetical protein